MKIELSKKEKKWLGRISYLLYLGIICEIALRVYLVYFADDTRFINYASYSMMENRFKEPGVVPHSFLGYANNPRYQVGLDQHNSRGFRGEEVLVEKPDSVFRIVCLGGSTTYSSGVEDYKQSYPYLLGEALNQKGFNVEVINAGCEGYNTWHSYMNYLLKVEELDPDMLIVYHAVNDLYYTRMVWPPENYLADQSGAINPYSPRFGILRKLSILRIPLVYAGIIEPDRAMARVYQVAETGHILTLKEQLLDGTYPSGIFEEVSLDSMVNTNKPVYFKQNLERLIQKAKSNGTEVVLSTFIYSDQFPEFSPELSLEPYQRGIREHNDITRQLAEEYELPLLDFVKEMSPEPQYITDGIHFSLPGNEKRVEILTEFLSPVIEASKKGEAEQ